MKFTETYRQYFPFRHFPASNYLTESEIEFVFNDSTYVYSPATDSIVRRTDPAGIPVFSHADSIRADSLKRTIEKKFYDWESANVFEEFSRIVTEGLQKDYPALEETYRIKKDSVFSIIKFLFDMNFGSDLETSLIDATAGMLGIDSTALYQSNKRRFDVFSDQINKLYDPGTDDYFNTMIMPGLMIGTNAQLIDGNSIRWTIKFEYFFAGDYVMYAESRIVNTWAIILSIVVAVLLLMGIIAGLLKKRVKR